MVVLVIAAVVAAVISLAAIVDPFSWLPPVGEIWGHCEEMGGSSCDLAKRFPGFWGHALVNLAYTLITGCTLLILVAAVLDLRESRPARFAGEEEAMRYAAARTGVAVAATIVAMLAAVPIVVALA